MTALLALVFALVNTPSGRTMLVSAGILLDLVPLLAVREGFFPEVRYALARTTLSVRSWT